MAGIASPITPQDTADNIPAQLSPGEFIVPAPVVRYMGVEKLNKLVQQAQQGLMSASMPPAPAQANASKVLSPSTEGVPQAVKMAEGGLVSEQGFQDLYTKTFNDNQSRLGSTVRMEAYKNASGRTAYRHVGQTVAPGVQAPQSTYKDHQKVPDASALTGLGGTSGGGSGGGSSALGVIGGTVATGIGSELVKDNVVTPAIDAGKATLGIPVGAGGTPFIAGATVPGIAAPTAAAPALAGLEATGAAAPTTGMLGGTNFGAMPGANAGLAAPTSSTTIGEVAGATTATGLGASAAPFIAGATVPGIAAPGVALTGLEAAGAATSLNGLALPSIGSGASLTGGAGTASLAGGAGADAVGGTAASGASGGLGAAAGGAAGGLVVGNLLNRLTGGNQTAGMVAGGVAGGIAAGLGSGAGYVGLLGAAGGPIGLGVAAIAALVFGQLFKQKPSNKFAGGSLYFDPSSPEGQRYLRFDGEGREQDPTNMGIRDQVFDTANLFGAILKKAGATNIPTVNADIGGRDGWKLSVGAQEGEAYQFSQSKGHTKQDDLAVYLVQNMITKSEGIPEEFKGLASNTETVRNALRTGELDKLFPGMDLTGVTPQNLSVYQPPVPQTGLGGAPSDVASPRVMADQYVDTRSNALMAPKETRKAT